MARHVRGSFTALLLTKSHRRSQDLTCPLSIDSIANRQIYFQGIQCGGKNVDCGDYETMNQLVSFDKRSIKNVEISYAANGQSRGSVKIFFYNQATATLAVNKLQGMSVDGRPLQVYECRLQLSLPPPSNLTIPSRSRPW
jgi:hypothetical protein